MDLPTLAFAGLIAAQVLAVIAFRRLMSREQSTETTPSDRASDYRVQIILAGGE